MSVTNELSHLICNYLDSHPNLSVNAIANYSGVAETTLRRIKNGELKGVPNNDNVLKLLFYVYKTKDLNDIIEKAPKATSDHLKNEYHQIVSSDTPVAILDKSIIENEIDYLLLVLASSTKGVLKEEVSRQFGELGHNYAKRLIGKEILKDLGDRYQSLLDCFRLPDESFIQNFKAMANYIKVDREERVHPNLYYNLSESLNEDAYQKVRSIQIQASREIIDIMNNSKNHGDIAMFSLIAVDTMK